MHIQRLHVQPLPDCIIGFYDLVFSWDHLLKRAWIVSSGYPHQEESDRYQRAKSRIEWALSLIDEVKALPTIHELNYKPDDFRSNFHKEDYIEAVNRVKEYIRAGLILFMILYSSKGSYPFGHLAEKHCEILASKMSPAPK